MENILSVILNIFLTCLFVNVSFGVAIPSFNKTKALKATAITATGLGVYASIKYRPKIVDISISSGFFVEPVQKILKESSGPIYLNFKGSFDFWTAQRLVAYLKSLSNFKDIKGVHFDNPSLTSSNLQDLYTKLSLPKKIYFNTLFKVTKHTHDFIKKDCMKSFLNNVFALCSDNPVLVPVIALPVLLILKKRTSFSETGSSFLKIKDSYGQYSTGDPISSAPHTPDWFRKNFDAKVAGQEHVKEVLSVLAARFHRLTFTDVQSNVTTPVTAPRIFLVGPSGCGKTFLATVMAELTKIPSLVVDTSQLTAAGYIGKSVSEILHPLKGRVNKGNGHKAVVVLDEFDKKASRETSGLDVGRTEVQTQVLTMLGGTSDATQFGIRTDSIFFIATGAFSKLREQYPVITPEILIQHGGMSPEVMGRFTHILILNPLSKEEYLSLLKMTSGPIEAAKKLFTDIGVSVEIEESVLEELANYLVYNPSCMNVRDLKNRVEKAFLPLEGLAYNGCCKKNITITDSDFFLR